ncbi:MAG: dockerin type I domain-containing protein [Ruminococcus sp.]
MKKQHRIAAIVTAAILCAGCAMPVSAGGQTSLGVTDLGDGTYMTFRINDPFYDYLTFENTAGSARYWVYQDTDLIVTVLEDGYAETFDPAEVISGACAYPVSAYPYTNEFHAGIFSRSSGFYLSQLPEENVRIVTGVSHDPNDLYKIEGVKEVYRADALISTEAWAEEPCVTAYTYLAEDAFTLKRLEKDGITGVTAIEPIESNLPETEFYRYAYHIYLDVLSADQMQEDAYYETLYDLCRNKMWGTDYVHFATPTFVHNEAVPEFPDDYVLSHVPTVKTTVDEDGTIRTGYQHKNYYEEWIYPVDSAGFLHREDYENGYAVKVTYTDEAAFTEAYGEKYAILKSDCGMELGENEAVIAPSNKTNLSYGLSGWTLADANAAARDVLHSPAVTTVEVEHCFWEMDSGHMFVQTSYGLNSDTPLTEADFSWLEEGYSVTNISASNTSDVYSVTISVPDSADISSWEQMRYFMQGCLDNISSVYAIEMHPMQHDIALSNQFDAVYTAEQAQVTSGDINGDSSINADDAYTALHYYANHSVGRKMALTNAEDTEAAARTAAETIAFTSADVNGDGVVDGEDAYRILKHYAAESVGGTPGWD